MSVWAVTIHPPAVAALCLAKEEGPFSTAFEAEEEPAVATSSALCGLLVQSFRDYVACIDPQSHIFPLNDDEDTDAVNHFNHRNQSRVELVTNVGEGISLGVQLVDQSAVSSSSSWCTLAALRESNGLPVLFSTTGCSPAAVHFSLSFRSSMVAFHEMSRQYDVRCRMALAQTMGGGWASVKNAKEALRCAIQLYSLAEQIGDEATMRKCRVFVGWALMWAGKLDPALLVFYGEQENAAVIGDASNYQRCVAALLHHAAGSDAVSSRSVGQDLGTEWVSLFQASAPAASVTTSA